MLKNQNLSATPVFKIPILHFYHKITSEMQPIINSVSNTTKNDTTTVFLKRHLSQSSDTLDIEKVKKLKLLTEFHN